MTPKKLNTEATPQSHTLEALKQLIPACFTEVKNEQGELQQVVDWDILKQILGENIADENHERYQFTWAGKQAARLEANKATSQTLRPVPEDSVDWDTTENLYIEGDNLQVLKLLQQGYMGKVKMIYIDPPYNTGNDFVYKNKFTRLQAEEDLESGDIDEEGNRYRKNNRTNGHFHSNWCSMIYPRLLIARSLLTEDGVIFISIDDNEVHNLRKICDEVFGEGNFVENYVWESTFRPDNSSDLKRSNAESILLYTKNRTRITRLFGTIEQSEGLPSLTKNSMKVSTLSFKAGVVKTLLDNGIYKAGDKGKGYTLLNDVEVQNGVIISDFKISGKIIWGQEYLDNEIKKGTDIIVKSESFVLYSKKTSTTSAPNTIIPKKRVGDVLEGRAEVTNLLSSAIFSYPKPISLVKYLASIIDTSRSLILDFFSGSATTAHAVMQLNAEDGGKRKYICVQLNEATPEDSEARKAGYASIPEIAKERIRRAGQKIKAEAPLTTQNLDIGFRVLRLADSNFNEVNRHPNEYDQVQLDLFATNIKEDRNDLDLLFGAMLSWGVPLSLPISTAEIDGCRLYNVNDGDLVACFAENVSEAVVKAMASKVSLRVLFRDSCFAEDKHKINIFEIFKQHLGWDEKEAMDKIRVI